jgi:predicted nucleic acid-binding protein
MHYFDTSFLVPLILLEPTSDDVSAVMGRLATENLAVSQWARLEFSSLLARNVRMGLQTADAARLRADQFIDLIGKSFSVLLPTGADFDRAIEYLGLYETALRAPDAFHLAIARNNGARAIYSLDKTMLRAGHLLGLPMNPGIRIPGYEI